MNYSKNTGWSAPRALIKASINDYIYWTNGIVFSPNGNKLHLFFTNVRYLSNGNRYYGASHIYSIDWGMSWKQFGNDSVLQIPVKSNTLELIEDNPLTEDRSVSPAYILKYKAPGPTNYSYNNIMLSNPVTDTSGRPWVIEHNNIQRIADLVTYTNGRWDHIPLLDKIQDILPGYVIHPQSSLSRLKDGELEIILQVMPKDQVGYGAKGTGLVRLRFSTGGKLLLKELVCDIDPDHAQWQPALEHWQWNEPFDKPALMYTKGINQGGFSNNVNETNAEVYLKIP
jgi:hypothetical protein